MTTKSREAFEADHIARDNGSGIMSPNHDDGTYFSNFQQEAWERWQAAEAYGRKQALEEAVEVCGKVPYQNDSYVAGVELCKSAIKELIK